MAIPIVSLDVPFCSSLLNGAFSARLQLLFDKELKHGYWFWILFLFLGTFLILKYFMNNMGLLIKTATILSFLSAPFYPKFVDSKG